MQVVTLVASLLGFVALTLGTALFVASEFSLTALERSTVEADLRHRGDRRSRLVAQAHRTLSFQLSGAQLGITITTLITGYIAEPVLAQLFSPAFDAVSVPADVSAVLSTALALVIATSLSMVLGELVPKNYAISRPLSTARATSGPMIVFSTVFGGVIRGLNGLANLIVRRLGVEPAEELRSARSPQELVSLVRNSAREGALDKDTALIVGRSLQFGERTAEELMTPRVTVDALDEDASVRDLIIASAESGFSRFPIVVDGDLDNIVGFVHVKQAFTVPVASRDSTRLGAIARPVPIVPASLDGDAVMTRIRADGMQVAVVVDEYGGTAGIVTTEDLIEEIVGDVTDEHDDEEADVAPDGTGFRCSGLLRIDELPEAVGYRPPEGEYDTLAGLVVFILGRLAVAGDEVDLPERADDGDNDGEPMRPAPRWRARVVALEGRRIETIMLSPITDDSDGPRGRVTR
ncbi:hemolysin family protein [Williamsia sp. CHRR-6]|uniref:hemolysin family protein n=1 Tax=Williamsia sp. CHRR-6 TaxID=2835871 RepID=UPI001BDAA36D|nr:hemolysin family protein [Williamsia sp. CHRR-6]MBT0568209.1 HlyC/CorC family transporter [Williamsia sp. CHRR-6]